MSTTNHTTAGRQSRLAVSAALAFAHQDAGIESALNSGCLDATEQIPCGACYGVQATAKRNGVRLVLTCRERSAS
ncbi:hypothetical protein [Janthinobacterium psychrotolerans]|uniref:Uncharacterized protein n=1 Tax=Janthinobacterium psychrotolerans TaxID=1747903 RepID=A0A1A7C046_9BURK|nr:hypothetical protein [Janthinobacterium psychrotolerans]OBV38100.1 hypothetical protein ASR47_100553 [Janthinobacterium psychrotolerans]